MKKNWIRYAVKMFGGFLYVCLVLQITGMLPGENEKTDYLSVEQNLVSDQLEEPPKVAITFDDGPSAKYTGQLLDGLK